MKVLLLILLVAGVLYAESEKGKDKFKLNNRGEKEVLWSVLSRDTATCTATATPNWTSTPSPTFTVTPSITKTVTQTITPNWALASPTPTATATTTASPSPSASATATATVTEVP